MRIYQTATIIEERLTGFQSPCSEFAEKPLSLDERFGLGNPSLVLVQSEADFFHLGIQKKDWLLIDLSKRPDKKSLMVVMNDDEAKILQGDIPETNQEDLKIGVIVALFRDFL